MEADEFREPGGSAELSERPQSRRPGPGGRRRRGATGGGSPRSTPGAGPQTPPGFRLPRPLSPGS